MIISQDIKSKQRLSSIIYQYDVLPHELYAYPQWVVWKWGEMRDNGKRAKIPISPHTHTPARVNDPKTWARYSQALSASAIYAGIGLVMTQDSPYSFLDFDDCIHDGRIDPQIQEVMKRFPGAYVEVSPSGNGIKMLLRGKLPGLPRRQSGIECYDRERYTTLTGQAIQVAKKLTDHTTELAMWYREVFPVVTTERQVYEEEVSPELPDWKVINLAKRNPKFKQLWEGDTSAYSSQSEADMALFGILAFYTQAPEQIERIARKWELARDKWDIHPTYLTDSIETAIENRTGTYQPRTERRERIEIVTSGEPIEIVRAKIQHSIETALTGTNGVVIAAPCGVGKSSIAATLGAGKNVAWIAERHEMATQVKGLEGYRHIQPCTKENCPEWERHEQLSRKGYSTWKMHKDHFCDYIKQFDASGSAIYMSQYAETYYPTQHNAIVVDEFNPLSWVKETKIVRGDVLRTKNLFISATSFLEALLDALDDMPTGNGKQLFDYIARKIPLRETLMALVDDRGVMEERPYIRVAIDDAPPVFLPTLIKQMIAELDMWETGRAWNSAIRVENREITILIPRRFHTGTSDTPLLILDATANEYVMGRLLGRGNLHTVRYEVQLPPGMQHIAVRTGKKYSRYHLLEAKNSSINTNRVIKEIRYVLGNTDKSKIGLITFKRLEQNLGDVLGIPAQYRGHFYGVRGSNAYEECETLLVVGTPYPNLNQVEYFTRMLYLNDPEPIDTTIIEGKYKDTRLKETLEYLSRAELTQVAHRNRPLAHTGKRVITLCDGEIDFLPVTERVSSIPNLRE